MPRDIYILAGYYGLMARSPSPSFPARLGEDLHERLRTYADENDVRMNDVVIAGVRTILEGERAPVVASADLADARTDLACAAVQREIGALKGIAKHLENMGQLNLSCVVYAAAAEVIGHDDPALAARELVTTADHAEKRRQSELAMALLQTALVWQPDNLVAHNRLGQLCFYRQQFDEAIDHLARVRDRDNRARLFHGWSTLYVAEKDGQPLVAEQGRDEVRHALETWAFGSRDSRERDRWLRQVLTLDALGGDYAEVASELVAFANGNTSWPRIDLEDFRPVSEPEHETDSEDRVALSHDLLTPVIPLASLAVAGAIVGFASRLRR